MTNKPLNKGQESLYYYTTMVEYKKEKIKELEEKKKELQKSLTNEEVMLSECNRIPNDEFQDLDKEFNIIFREEEIKEIWTINEGIQHYKRNLTVFSFRKTKKEKEKQVLLDKIAKIEEERKAIEKESHQMKIKCYGMKTEKIEEILKEKLYQMLQETVALEEQIQDI